MRPDYTDIPPPDSRRPVPMRPCSIEVYNARWDKYGVLAVVVIVLLVLWLLSPFEVVETEGRTMENHINPTVLVGER